MSGTDDGCPSAGPGSVIRWLSDNGVSVEESGDFDEDALQAALVAQLGAPHSPGCPVATWRSVALACMAHAAGGLHAECDRLAREAAAMPAASWKLRDGIGLGSRSAGAWDGFGLPRSGESAHAYQTTWMLSLAAEAISDDPLFHRRLSWLAGPDPALWAAIDGFGGPSLRCQGLGIAAHHAAERMTGIALPEPQVDGAVEAVILFLDRVGPAAVRRAMETCPGVTRGR